MKITIKELLNISGGWTEEKQCSTMYLDEFKSGQVQKLVDLISCIDYNPAAITKSSVKKVALELGVDEEYLRNELAIL